MTSLDILIPFYNYGRFLERCVDSVPSQDGVQVRVGSDRCFDQGVGGEADAAKTAAVAPEIDQTIVRTKRWWKNAAKSAAGWNWCQSYGQTKAALPSAAIAARQGGMR